MSKKIKLAYFISLGIIIIPPLAQQWEGTIAIPKKEALLPPELPLITKANEQLLDTILAHNLWEKSHNKIIAEAEKKREKSTPQQTKKWQLKGIGFKQMSTPLVIITTNDDTKVYREGDTLPDGTLLNKITINSIIINKEGEQKNVYLFKDS